MQELYRISNTFGSKGIEQAAIENGTILNKDEDVSTVVCTVTTEIKAGEYLEIVILPGNEGYARRINFYSIDRKSKGGYNVRCMKENYECFLKVRQR